MTDRLAQLLRAQCEERWAARGLTRRPAWPEFRARLEAEFRRLAELLFTLYGSRPDFAFRLEDIIAHAFAAFEARPEALKERDRRAPPETAWFASESQVGAVAYVDRFAGSFKGLAARIPYLKELGVSYLHLMPFFLAPEGENDGGYAVSSYRETNPALGEMADLERTAALLAGEGIALVADFVFNHSSNEHEWARKARAGDPDFQDYYWIFAEKAETEPWQAGLRDIFPETRKGSFTRDPVMGKWVWTTFNSYQWDLNYSNPAVFDAMAGEMTALANRGIAVLRLDAVAFIWKKAGTNCENLPEAHNLVRAFQAVARLACPSLLFKSEAIVHPDRIAEYIDLRECQLSYNPLLMAELWEASATREVALLALSLRKRHHLPDGCAWVNYVRCHDDIGWTFADGDAAELGIKGRDHRDFLNRFYLGVFPGSFSRGLSFQYNPHTGDRRICGTTASLAGVEKALAEGSGQELDTAVRRVLLLYGLAFSAGGLPLVYLGDELGVQNRYEYVEQPSEAADSRWVHRPLWSETRFAARKDAEGVTGRVYRGICALSLARRANPVFGAQGLAVLDSGHPSVLAYRKVHGKSMLIVIANFADRPIILPAGTMGHLLSGKSGRDLIGEKQVFADEDLEIEACGLLWVLSAV